MGGVSKMTVSTYEATILQVFKNLGQIAVGWQFPVCRGSGCKDNKNALYSAKTSNYSKKKPNKTHFCLFSYHLFRLKHQIIRRCGWNALKGQPAHSPGQRPGLWERGKFALKGQKNGVLVKLLPFQGDSHTSRIPRALPRADISLALQAVLHN